MHIQATDSGLVRFKPYNQSLTIEVPILVESFLSGNKQVQLIHHIVEQIPTSTFDLYYSGNGCPPYHPKMMLKVWLYGICQRVYTCRKLAKKLREDLGFIWLSANQQPSYKTLNNFRSGLMGDLIDEVFAKLLVYLLEQGHIDISDLYIDGSKWEANNNKHQIIWRKNTERYKGQVLARVQSFLSTLKELQALEDAEYGNNDLAEQGSAQEITVILNSQDLATCIGEINELAASESQKTKAGQLRSYAKKLSDEQVKLTKYEQQESLLSGRNSYAKTDPDATGIRMKDGQLKPGYNAQITTSNQYILHASIHQTASDTPTFVSHLEGLKERLKNLKSIGWKPDFTMDAAYGSEENYQLIEAEGGRAFVKYFSWYRQVTGKLAKKIYQSENWDYNEKEDYYLCPEGKKLLFREMQTKTTQTGFERFIRVYECESCQGCPVFEDCRGEKANKNTNRCMHKSFAYERYKKQAFELLRSEEGNEKRSQRSVDVETPFANIKYNMGHRRFVLRGLVGVETEFKMLAVAHNIIKLECEETGKWQDYYAQRAAKALLKKKKRA